MASGLLGISTSGLLAFQSNLNTIGHNISNVNTDGYSRQTVDLTSNQPQVSGFGFTGTGVSVSGITRSYDAFVEASVRANTSSSSEFTAFNNLAVQLDNILADTDAGMSSSITSFFNAMHDVADAPATSATREVLFNEAEQLAVKFSDLASYVEDTRGQINNSIRGNASEINRLTQNIADLNESVLLATGRSGGHPPNDLLDQRDALIRDLSGFMEVSTVTQDDGAINIFIGKGQLLVRGSDASQLTTFVVNGKPSQLGVAIDGGSGPNIPISENLIGGKLGGVINFRDRLLDPASNSLGRVAIALGTLINEQNNRGMDIDGLLGADMFSVGQPEVLVQQGGITNISVGLGDVNQLTNLDYKLTFNAGTWGLTRSDTGQNVAMTGTGTAANPFVVDGFEVTVNTVPANGDSYDIHPTRNGALDMQRVMSSARQLATAAPVSTAASNANTGTGSISAGVVTDISNASFQTTSGQLTPPVLVRFTAANSYDLLDNSNPAAPVVLEAGIAYDPTIGSEIFPTPGGISHGYQIKLTGAVAAGDEFSTQYNTGGIGDNRNALIMAEMFSDKLLEDGTASFSGSYNSLVVDVGTGTRQSELGALSHGRLLEQTLATRESISGVNLDEEAANLVRYQQAYQASAQVVAVASTLFDVLLGAVRR